MTHSVHIGPKVRRCDSVRPFTHVLVGNRIKEKFRPVFKPTSELSAEERKAARLPALPEKSDAVDAAAVAAVADVAVADVDAPKVKPKEDPREKFTGEERVAKGFLTPAEHDQQRKFVTRTLRGWFSALTIDWFESSELAEKAKEQYPDFENLEVVPVSTVDYDG